MNIKKILAATALVAGLAALPTAASATPNFLGPSGYILTPDASVTPAGCVNIGYHYFDVDKFIPTRNRGIFDVPDFQVLGGNIGLFDRLEVGGSWFNRHNDDLLSGPNGDAVWLNAKLAVLRQDSPIQLAGGVMDALDDSDARAAYVVGSVNVGEKFKSKLLPRTLRVGAGYGTGHVIDGIFVNGGFMIGKHVELMGEWIDNQSDEPFENELLGKALDGNINVGGRLHVLEGLTLDAGALGVDADDPIITVGATYTHCFGKKHKKHDKKDKDEEEGRQSSSPLFKSRQGKFGVTSLASAR